MCRFGGDEFLIFIHPIENLEYLNELATRIFQVVSKPLEVFDNQINTTCSAGIALAPVHSDSYHEILRYADIALYSRKDANKNNFSIFDDEMQRQVEQKTQLVKDLKSADIASEFQLHYQPKISITTNKIIGAEALIRWQHPSQGLIGPDVFIPIAESSGHIIELSKWVLFTACRQFKTWLDAGYELDNIAVNLSPVQFKLTYVEQVVA